MTGKTGFLPNADGSIQRLGLTVVSRLFDLFVDEGHQLRFAQRAHFGGSERAVFKKHQSRDSANAKFSGDFSVFIDIHFGNVQFACVGG